MTGEVVGDGSGPGCNSQASICRRRTEKGQRRRERKAKKKKEKRKKEKEGKEKYEELG